MSDFSAEIDAVLGSLKQAAIDAYMRLIMGRNDSSYLMNVEEGFESVTIVVERPQNGAGGGKTVIYDGALARDGGDAFTNLFNEIRAIIDGVVDPWRSLPDPSKLQSAMDTATEVASILAPDGADGGGGVGLQASIAEIERHLGSMTGQTIAAFKQNFLGVLDSAVTNIYLLPVNAGAGMAGEQGALQQAREDFISVLNQSTARFNEVAKMGGSPGRLLFALVKSANSMIGNFLPAPAKVVSSSVGVVLGLIDELGLVEADEPAASAADYEAAMSAFQDSVKKLNGSLRDIESELTDKLREINLTTVSSYQQFDLRIPKAEPHSDEYSVTKIDEDAVDDIVNVYLPDIASFLSTAANRSNAMRIDDELDRDASIGSGGVGSKWEINAVCSRLESLLRELAWEVEFAQDQLRLIRDLFVQNDEAGRDALYQHERQLDYQHHPYDPRGKQPMGGYSIQ